MTEHTPQSSTWQWRTRTAGPSTTAVVFARDGHMRLHDGAPTNRVLLHSSHITSITWERCTAATIVWLRTNEVLDAGVTESAQPMSLPTSPLTEGFRAFVVALTSHESASDGISAYVVERLLVEMAFGAILEHGDNDIGATEVVHDIRHARKLMLLNRVNPDYGVDELAADMHMSLRHLQRMFARSGSTPTAVFRTLRVELAVSLLQDPRHDALSMHSIASYSGFTNVQALRRAFRAAGQTLPRRSGTH